MTTTASVATPRRSVMNHDQAMRLAADEYARAADQLATLGDADWQAATCCPGWSVRDMAGHMLGMAEMAASMLEQRRQLAAAKKAGGDQLDALTAHQVAKYSGLDATELVAQYRSAGQRAARSRRQTPGLLRRMRLRPDQRVGDSTERWTIGFLTEVILTRDPWLHRTDITAATGAPMVLTTEHDSVIVDDVVREWLARHGQPVELDLTGPAGGRWVVGDGEKITMDAVEFCRTLSGRGDAAGLLAHQVPF